MISIFVLAINLALFPTIIGQPAPQPTCEGADIISGYGYKAHTTDCNKYIQCDWDINANVQIHIRQCPCALFWSQSLLTCIFANEVQCPADPCATGNINSYAVPGNCSAYWSCSGSRTDGYGCCPDGFSYNPAHAGDANVQVCQADANCASCECVHPTLDYPCHLRPNQADLATYVDVTTNQVMPCAPGTNFNQTTCGCTTIVQIDRVACPLDFDMKCDVYPIMDRANRAWILNNDVLPNPATGGCQFFGAGSRLMILRYANMDWRYKFAWMIDFQQTGGNLPQTLLYNTECGHEQATVILRLVATNQIEAVFVMQDETHTATVSYTANERNKVYLVYDGVTLTLTAQAENAPPRTDTKAASKRITRVQCAMQVGWGPPDQYFVGNIYEIKAYAHCVPENFLP